MPLPKAIIFDFTGIFSNDDEILFIDAISRKHNIERSKVEEVFYKLQKEAEYGKLEEKEFCERFCKELSIPLDYGLLDFKFTLKKMINPEMMNLVDELRKKGFKLGLLSNDSNASWSRAKKALDIELHFDIIVFSHMVGARKPSEEIFQYLLKNLNLEKEEIIFIDDSEKNVKGAEDIGIKSFLFKTLDQIKKEILNFLDS